MDNTPAPQDAASIITIASLGVSFACLPGSTLLLSGLAAGIDLPYECASGACGSCRCKIISGEVESLWPDAPGLSQRDRRRGGVILLCQSRPRNDLTIELPARGAHLAPSPRRTAARLAARRDLTHDMQMVTLEVEGGMPYLPGQFVLLDIPGVGRRAYSIANAGDPTDSIDLIVKLKTDGAVSTAIQGMRLGAMLTIEGPYGRAYFRADGDRPVVAIAGGSGLAPIWAVAQAAARAGRNVDLYFGVNTPRDLCFTEEFAEFASASPACRVQTVIREQGNSVHRAGLVGDAVIEDRPDLNHADIYLAGPPGMVDAILGRLATERRATLDRVFFDRFC